MSAPVAASIAPLASNAERMPSTAAAEEHPHADAAEEVRAWLVTARGGAPFLSGSDSRRLENWLDGGVGVRDLLRAIDETAAHRRAKRLRGPFSLRSIEPALRGGPARATPRLPRTGAQALGSAPTADISWPDSTALEERLKQRTGGDPASLDDSSFLELSALVRVFFEQAWAGLAEHHASLLAEALGQLGDVADLVEQDGRAALCEEYAREALRSRYPLLRTGGLLG